MHCQISIFEVKMMVKIGVIFMPFANPPSLIPALQNIGILDHKKAKLRKHMRQSVRLVKLLGLVPALRLFRTLEYISV